MTGSPSPPEVSLMVVTRNRPELLRLALEHAARQVGVAMETVVVDDASDYDVDAVAEPFRSQLDLTLVRMPVQSGTCIARNRGILESRAEIIIQLDDDSWLIDEDAALTIRDYLASREDVGALALRVYNSWSDAPKGVGSVFARWSGEHLSEEYSFQGCGVAFRRSAAIRAGMYPAAYTYYGEEDYLAARLLQAGYRIQLFAIRGVVHGYDTIADPAATPEVLVRKRILNSSHIATTFLLLMPLPLNLLMAFLRVVVAMRQGIPLVPMLKRIRVASGGTARDPMTWKQAIAYLRLRRRVRGRLK